jgi:hypothetical protein
VFLSILFLEVKPLRVENKFDWLGSSVGTSERLKIVRSPVRSRPKPLTSRIISLLGLYLDSYLGEFAKGYLINAKCNIFGKKIWVNVALGNSWHINYCHRLSDIYWYVLCDYLSTSCKLSSRIILDNI